MIRVVSVGQLFLTAACSAGSNPLCKVAVGVYPNKVLLNNVLFLFHLLEI